MYYAKRHPGISSFNVYFTNYQVYNKKMPLRDRGLSPLFNSKSRLYPVKNLLIQ